MSRRPRLSAYDAAWTYQGIDDLEAADAPHLAPQSLSSRIMVCAMLLCVTSSITGLVVVGVQLVRHSGTQPPQQTIQQPSTFVSIKALNGEKTRPIRGMKQRSVLMRMAMLQRAPAPQQGVSLESVERAFPKWQLPNATDGTTGYTRRDRRRYNTDIVLGDLALALSYLAAERNGDG